jgi:predicted PhzF superfamily epimerase YddE/YHI9
VDLDQYQVDAFTTRPFGGNPAAIVPLKNWLPDALMQAIAAENNVSETAFYVPEEKGFGLRWFTPALEVDLCGHATLAAAHVLFNELACGQDTLYFQTRSGELVVRQDGEGIHLDFPALPLAPTAIDPAIERALGGDATEAFSSSSPIYLYASEARVRALAPDIPALLAASELPVIVTAPGDKVDFVSRFFGPQVGIDEDPVTGSAHCALTPLWSQRLGKTRMQALQVSARLGELLCELRGDRVRMSGRALTFLRGKISVQV